MENPTLVRPAEALLATWNYTVRDLFSKGLTLSYLEDAQVPVIRALEKAPWDAALLPDRTVDADDVGNPILCMAQPNTMLGRTYQCIDANKKVVPFDIKSMTPAVEQHGRFTIRVRMAREQKEKALVNVLGCDKITVLVPRHMFKLLSGEHMGWVALYASPLPPAYASCVVRLRDLPQALADVLECTKTPNKEYVNPTTKVNFGAGIFELASASEVLQQELGSYSPDQQQQRIIYDALSKHPGVSMDLHLVPSMIADFKIRLEDREVSFEARMNMFMINKDSMAHVIIRFDGHGKAEENSTTRNMSDWAGDFLRILRTTHHLLDAPPRAREKRDRWLDKVSGFEMGLDSDEIATVEAIVDTSTIDLAGKGKDTGHSEDEDEDAGTTWLRRVISPESMMEESGTNESLWHDRSIRPNSNNVRDFERDAKLPITLANLSWNEPVLMISVLCPAHDCPNLHLPGSQTLSFTHVSYIAQPLKQIILFAPSPNELDTHELSVIPSEFFKPSKKHLLELMNRELDRETGKSKRNHAQIRYDDLLDESLIHYRFSYRETIALLLQFIDPDENNSPRLREGVSEVDKESYVYQYRTFLQLQADRLMDVYKNDDEGHLDSDQED
ncbi:hypothetical protein OPT61_g5868 [Boeremia exigua]|uniref:Uncharacterized protein n=1 Tax=Boeremia exigua TaxID=749465 RepID=A0ACC2I8Q8_9PLEO|nr:hypothetical protein OPT61_g5868 [Boeremia exigua]